LLSTNEQNNMLHLKQTVFFYFCYKNKSIS